MPWAPHQAFPREAVPYHGRAWIENGNRVAGFRPRRGASWRSRRASRFRVQEDRHGTVVDQLHLHVGPEDPLGHRHASLAQQLAHALVEAAGPVLAARDTRCTTARMPKPHVTKGKEAATGAASGVPTARGPAKPVAIDGH